MLKNLLAHCLIVLLLLPLNATAGAAMGDAFGSSDSLGNEDPAMTMAAHGVHHDVSAETTLYMAHDAEPAHAAIMQDSQQQAMMAAHEHGAEDCDEFCMNCSNHCSSTAIVTGGEHVMDLQRRYVLADREAAISFTYLLFRPPILS